MYSFLLLQAEALSLKQIFPIIERVDGKRSKAEDVVYASLACSAKSRYLFKYSEELWTRD
jgi:hypothetical protein